MKPINSRRRKNNTSSNAFKTLVEELKDSNRRVSKQNDRLRNKLGVESKSNEDISRETEALCNSILGNSHLKMDTNE